MGDTQAALGAEVTKKHQSEREGTILERQEQLEHGGQPRRFRCLATARTRRRAQHPGAQRQEPNTHSAGHACLGHKRTNDGAALGRLTARLSGRAFGTRCSWLGPAERIRQAARPDVEDHVTERKRGGILFVRPARKPGGA